MYQFIGIVIAAYLLEGLPGVTSCGENYIRWGRTTCPRTATLVYSGIAAGSWWSATGGGANYLCLPRYPQYTSYAHGIRRVSLYGAEYQLWGHSPYPTAIHDDNVPCAVCSVNRCQKLMIPARTSCPSGWTREYYGYLMTTAPGNNHYRTMYECMDREPQTIPGSGANTDGAVFYHVEASCNGIPCPLYSREKELTCVVCTK